MRLLIAADIFPPEPGGPATYSVTIAKMFTQLGEQVKIVSLTPGSDASLVPCPLFCVTKSGKWRRYLQYLYLLFRESRDCDLIYAMGPVNAGLPALLVSWLRRKPLAIKVVGDYAWEQASLRLGVTESVDDFQSRRPGGFIGLLCRVERWVAGRASVVIVPSHYLRRLVAGWGAWPERINVIYNALPLPKAEDMMSMTGEAVSGHLTKGVGEKWIVTVARLVPAKGVATIIRVVAALSSIYPDVRLRIVGDGPERAALAESTRSLNIEAVVEFVGAVPRLTVLQYLIASDVFVLNSASEGLSHVILEALCLRRRVLASAVGGNPEVVIPGQTGALFEFNNEAQIRTLLVQALDGRMPAPFADEKQYKNWLNRFELPAMIKRTHAVLYSLLPASALKQSQGQSAPVINLMISLDKEVLNTTSRAAERMRGYGQSEGWVILVPAEKRRGVIRLSDTVRAMGSGGGQSKIRQFWMLFLIGRMLFEPEPVEFGKISTQDPFFTGLLGWLIKRQAVARGLPAPVFEVQVHGDFFGSPYYRGRGLVGWLRLRLDRFILGRADRIRVVGERVRQSLLRLGIPEEKMSVRPVALDTAAIVSRVPVKNARAEFPEAGRVFLFGGRLEPEKNLPWLVSVFGEFVKESGNLSVTENPASRSARLLIFGAGSEAEKIQAVIDKHGLHEQVKLRDWTGEMIDYIKTADAVLIPSLTESYSLLAMEAAAAGTPVIMTDVGVANYELKPGPKVKIVPVNDRAAFGRALREI